MTLSQKRTQLFWLQLEWETGQPRAQWKCFENERKNGLPKWWEFYDVFKGDSVPREIGSDFSIAKSGNKK